MPTAMPPNKLIGTLIAMLTTAPNVTVPKAGNNRYHHSHRPKQSVSPEA